MKRFSTSAGIPAAPHCHTGQALVSAARHFRTNRRLTTVVALLFLTLLATSCIFDSPNDQFYRTLWVSEEAPFGNAAEVAGYGLDEGTDRQTDDGGVGAEGESTDQNDSQVGDNLMTQGKLTIEFLCGGSVTVTAPGAVGSYGSYEHHGTTVYFANLRLRYHIDGPENPPLVIILEEAHRTDDLLLLSWHYSGSTVSYTTRMVRKGSYE